MFHFSLLGCLEPRAPINKRSEHDPQIPQSHNPKISVEPEWESPEEAAQRCNVSRQSIYILIARGRIEAKKFGGKTLINIAARRAYMAKLPAAKASLPKPRRKPEPEPPTAA